MRKEKTLLLNEIKEKIDSSTAMIVANYRNLAPNLSWQLRDQLAKSGGVFEVVRKRVFLKAAGQAGIAFDEAQLTGHIGVVFIQQPDPMVSTKAVHKFSEENGDFLRMICGQFDGKIIQGTDLVLFAKLPGINEMRASLLGLLTSPMSQVLSVLEAAISSIEQKS